jgi:predicted permease
MKSLLILLIFLTLGLVLKKFLTTKQQTRLSLMLNRFVIYISLPAMVLVYLNRVTFDSNLLIPIATAWSVFILISILVYIFGKRASYSKESIVAVIMLTAFTNSSFMGIPFTKAFFGDSGIKYAIMYDQLGSFLILAVFGAIILSIATPNRLRVKDTVIKVVTFPSFVALVFALIFQGINYPDMVLNLLKSLSSLLAPAALVSIGLNLVIKIPKDEIGLVALVLILKLLVTPIALYLIFLIAGVDSISSKVSIFESAMAPMVTSSMLAIMANIKPRFVATTLGYGIVLSFITLPIIYLLIK